MADADGMKALLCIVVYLALVCALAIVMALPSQRDGALADRGDEDL
jgi:type IV secretory pathway component VirB8